MASLIPLAVDTDETIYSAVRLRATKHGVSASDVVTAILRQTLAAEIAEVSGVEPLAALLQSLHSCWRAQRAYGSHRAVSSPGKLTE